ncbi:MAG: hypothetical protein HQL27_05975 [Candidatus Omnitrophica bacterium]|nr:hypothetical protein [Candidatus Omnitrophota bacterium]
MIISLSLFIAFFLPWIIGYELLSLILRRQKFNPVLMVSLSYGLGFGFLAYLMFVLSFFKLALTLCNVQAGLISSLAILLAIRVIDKKKEKNEAVIFEKKESLFGNASLLLKIIIALGILYVLYNVALILLRALIVPVCSWDSLATCVYNAKLIFYEKTIPPLKFLPHPSYPLGIPLMITWLNLNLGYFDEYYLNLISVFLFITFLCVFYYFLGYFTNKRWALLGVVLLISSNLIYFHAGIFYRDLPIMYYCCCALFLLVLWAEQANKGVALLSSTLIGISSFIKMEGSGYSIIFILLSAILINKTKQGWPGIRKNIFLFVFPALILNSVFYVVKFMQKVQATEHYDLSFNLLIHRIPHILEVFFFGVFFSANWNIFWFLFLVSILVRFRNKGKNVSIRVLILNTSLWIFILFVWALFSEKGGSALISPYTFSRVLIHYFPLIIALIILLLYPSAEAKEVK